MDKTEYLQKLNQLALDKTKYCIISGGSLLVRGLREITSDIDIKIQPDYFEELKKTHTFKKSPKFSYLYELGEDVELAVQPFSQDDFDIVEGYQVSKLEIELKWKIEHHRPKDQKDIIRIKEYLKTQSDKI